MDFLVQEEAIQKKDHPIWVERYRPKNLNDYIGNDIVKETCKIFVEKQDLPHLLFFGPAGTGKTSLAKILTSNISCDVLYVNASAENRVDDVRIKLKNFASGAGFKPLKVAILDESDRLTPEAQGALRNMMETYSIHTRFILTCNYFEKMIAPIVSRCQTFEIKPISKSDIARKLVNVLQAEAVNFTKEDIKFIVETYYPDIRKVINFAQQSNLNGTLKICKENAVEVDFLNKLIEILKKPAETSAFTQIRQLVVEIDPNSLELIYRHLLDKVDQYAAGKEAIIILRLAEALKQSTGLISNVRDIPFLACVYNILNDLKE
jgi:DNA polymerase III delta prime subunit